MYWLKTCLAPLGLVGLTLELTQCGESWYLLINVSHFTVKNLDELVCNVFLMLLNYVSVPIGLAESDKYSCITIHC